MKRIFLIGCLAFAAASPLTAETKVLAFAGSSREGSYNKKLVDQAASIARQLGATVTVIDLKDFPIPFYDADLEKKQGMPQNAKRLRALMMANDAIIIASPEYNGSIPAVLKNALDWVSRNENGGSLRDPFKGKKFAIMSASPGGGGGARGLVHLQQIIENIGGDVVEKEVSVKQANTAFNDKGGFNNPAIQQELQQEIEMLIPANVAK